MIQDGSDLLVIAPPPSGKVRRQIVGLDLLRMLAATVVLIYHFGFWHLTAIDNTLIEIIAPGLRKSLMAGSHYGWVGVEIFFLISGFVIAYSAEAGSAYEFARSRLLRLVPAVLICAPIAFILYSLCLATPMVELIAPLIRTLTFFPLFSSIDGVYWTLGIEISFYALIWLLIHLKLQKWIDHLPVLLGAISFGFWLFYFAGIAALEQEGLRNLFHRAIAFRPFQLLLLQHGCFFALGVLLKILSEKGITMWRTVIFIWLVATCWMEIVAQNGIIERAAQLSLSFLPALILWTLAFVGACVLIALNSRVENALGKQVQAIRRVGLMTYPLYLLHNPVGIAVAISVGPYVGTVAALVLGFLAAYFSAYLVSKYAEPSIRRRLSALLPIPGNRKLP